MINIKPIIESFGKDHIKIKINLFHTFINLDQTKRSNESHDILNQISLKHEYTISNILNLKKTLQLIDTMEELNRNKRVIGQIRHFTKPNLTKQIYLN